MGNLMRHFHFFPFEFVRGSNALSITQMSCTSLCTAICDEQCSLHGGVCNNGECEVLGLCWLHVPEQLYFDL